MARVKITEATVQIAQFVQAIAAAHVFRADEVDQLCAKLELDPFQLQELFERSSVPAADIPESDQFMPPAWYDNNVQMPRLLLALNDLLDFAPGEWSQILAGAGMSETDVAECFERAREQVAQAERKYRL